MPFFYRKHWLDAQIYIHIRAQTSLVPGISVIESARLFQRDNEIQEDQLSLEHIRRIYYRILNEVIAEKKEGRPLL